MSVQIRDWIATLAVDRSRNRYQAPKFAKPFIYICLWKLSLRTNESHAFVKLRMATLAASLFHKDFHTNSL